MPNGQKLTLPKPELENSLLFTVFFHLFVLSLLFLFSGMTTAIFSQSKVSEQTDQKKIGNLALASMLKLCWIYPADSLNSDHDSVR